MFTLQVKKNQIKVVKEKSELMTSGSLNVYPIQFMFSSEWSYLEKVAVFATDMTKDGPKENPIYNQLIDDNNRCFIPWEVNLVHSQHVYVGVFGTLNGEVVLPTIWADLGNVSLGVITGIEIEPPTPTLYEQMLAKLGELRSLVDTTRTKYAMLVLGSKSWDENKEQRASVPGVSANRVTQLNIPVPAANFELDYYQNDIRVVDQGNGTLTFRADRIPTVDIPVYVYMVNTSKAYDPDDPNNNLTFTGKFKFGDTFTTESDGETTLVDVKMVNDFDGELDLPMSAAGVKAIVGNIRDRLAAI